MSRCYENTSSVQSEGNHESGSTPGEPLVGSGAVLLRVLVGDEGLVTHRRAHVRPRLGAARELDRLGGEVLVGDEPEQVAGCS